MLVTPCLGVEVCFLLLPALAVSTMISLVLNGELTQLVAELETLRLERVIGKLQYVRIGDAIWSWGDNGS